MLAIKNPVSTVYLSKKRWDLWKILEQLTCALYIYIYNVIHIYYMYVYIYTVRIFQHTLPCENCENTTKDVKEVSDHTEGN